MGTHPIFESDFDCLTDFGLLKMKLLHHSQEVTVDEGVTCTVKSRQVTVTGPRGTLKKDFRHLKVEMKNTSEKPILIEKWLGSSRDKVRAAYAHFPINCTVVQGGELLEVRNFLGEKFLRKVPMAPGVTVEISKAQKDELYVNGNDIEAVSKSAARIQQSTTVKNKDIRKFLDGLYVSEKTTIVIPE